MMDHRLAVTGHDLVAAVMPAATVGCASVPARPTSVPG